MNYYAEGKQLLDGKEYQKADLLFTAGASEGDVKCFYGLLAVKATAEQDFSQELKQLCCVLPEIEKAAEAGDADACFIMGRCYEIGVCKEQNMKIAIDYYEKAASLGNSDGMFNLGCIYINMGEFGAAVAKKYFTASAALNNKNAIAALNHMAITEKQ